MLNERIRAARLESGLTQQQVAELLGIDRSSYSYYETGKSKISTENLKKLAVILGTEFDWLVQPEKTGGILHDSTRKKPMSIRDEKMYSSSISVEERKLLAQIRLIEFMGKKDELARFLDSMTEIRCEQNGEKTDE